MELPKEYLERMKTQLGGDFTAYLNAMEQPPKRALWVNTFKIRPDEFQACCGFSLTPTGQSQGAFFFPEEVPIGRDPLYLAGLCYVQEPAAMEPAALLPIRPGMRVLDLCAAPGGKSGQIARMLGGTGILVANDPVKSRAQVLKSNLERLGVTNGVVTNLYPEALSKALPDFFDAALVDAPCSGEGMFRKEPEAVRSWSQGTVDACAARQAAILDAAAKMLKPGGTLVYATCTFSPQEDEGAVEQFLHRHRDFSCGLTRRLYPHTFPGEGQFMALLQKGGGGTLSPAPLRNEKGKKPMKPQPCPQWEGFKEKYLIQSPGGEVRPLPDGRVFILPEAYAPALDDLRVLSAGICAGEARNGQFFPGHGLVMAYPAVRLEHAVSLEGRALDRYLAGEAIPMETNAEGWLAATVGPYPIGLGKATGGMMKNHLPKGLRICH